MPEPAGGGAVSLFAPAKINLYLHVLGRRADGYHLLDSLVAFADIGDRVSAAPAAGLSLAVDGPEAAALRDLGDDNLVLRAAHLLAEAAAEGDAAAPRPGARLRLTKRLPAAAGIGGGSSDAAATLRLLDRLWRRPLDQAGLAALALRLGADVPVCLAARPLWVGGIGEELAPAPGLPPAGIVLANPLVPVPTASVFRFPRERFSKPGRFAPMPSDAAGLAAALLACGNDLTPAALSLAPELALVLQELAALPGSLLARMSGSGATCFALFADRAAALAAGRVLVQARPQWWCTAGALLTAPPAIEQQP